MRGYLILAAMLFWGFFDNTWQTNWVEKWGVLCAILGILWIWKSTLEYRVWWLPLFLSYYLLACVLSVYLGGYHVQPPFMDKTFIQLLRGASWAHLAQVFVFLAFLTLEVDFRKPLFWLSWVFMAGILWSPNAPIETYLIPNPSLAATTVVILSGANILSLVGIFYTHSYTAFLAFAVANLWRFRRHIHGIEWLFVFMIPEGIACWLYKHPGHTPDNGRFWAWTHYWGWIQGQGWERWLFGSGPGTTSVWLPYLGFTHPIGEYAWVYPWAHNDYLQLLGEIGAVGTALAGLAVYEIWRGAKEYERTILIAFGTAMLTNMPLHWAQSALMLWAISKASIRRQTYY